MVSTNGDQPDNNTNNGAVEVEGPSSSAGEMAIVPIRPLVDHYTMSRFTEGEWKKHNEEVLGSSVDDLHKINVTEFNSRRVLVTNAKSADANQQKSTKKLIERAHEINRWKIESESSLEAMREEIKMLEEERKRVIQAKLMLMLVRSISSECIARRAMRDGYELSNDQTDQELIKEAALIRQVAELLDRTLSQIVEQLERNKSMKQRLEEEWSDKQEAHTIDVENIGYSNRSKTVLFKPASMKLVDGQTSEEGWMNATREVLSTAEAVRCQSQELRHLLEGAVLDNCMRDLKAQADSVDTAFAKGIAGTEQCVKALKAELDVVVRSNAETEQLIFDLECGIQGLEKASKVVQTRLDNRLHRPRHENARDRAQCGLFEEGKNLEEQIDVMKRQKREAESTLGGLVRARGLMEKELQNKLKTLYIDKERCQPMRAQYPSATALTGH